MQAEIPSHEIALPQRTGAGSLIAFLARLVGQHRLLVLGALMIAASLSEGFGLLLLVPMTQAVAGGGTGGLPAWLPPSVRALPLPVLLGLFAALVCLRALLVYWTRERQRELGLIATRRLRSLAHGSIARAEWRWLARQTGADHAATIMGQSERIGALANQVLALVAGAATLLALTAAALLIDWRLTLLAIALGLALALPLGWLRLRRNRDGESFGVHYTALQASVHNGIDHLRAARIAGAQAAIGRQFERAADRLMAVERDYYRKVGQANLAFQAGGAVTLAVLVYVGLEIAATPLAVLVPVLAIFARLVPVAATIQQGWRSWKFCQPALGDLLKLVGSARAAAEPEAGEVEPPQLTQALSVEHLTVHFEGRGAPVLRELDLVINAGTIVAVTGRSGVGKSTLADVLSGLLAPDSGAVLVDGVPLADHARIAWRRRVAYVEQSPYLFDDTIRANLAWERSGIGEADMLAAIDAASARFVLALPQGLDTHVGETGRQLSGGEQQRIALARALLQRPDLLILDEVSAALDDENEAAICRSIAGLRGRCTVVLLGHRPALTALADRVYRLEDFGGFDDR